MFVSKWIEIIEPKAQNDDSVKSHDTKHIQAANKMKWFLLQSTQKANETFC